MGMGDTKRPYQPEEYKIRDDVLLLTFPRCAMRQCPHPSVIRKYGVGGVANVSLYVCRRCKYHETYQYHGGVGCTYGKLEQDVQAGETDRVV